MTRVSIPGPDIEADVSAEQVAAYLLRPGSGWRYTGLSTEQGWQIFRHGRKRADLPVDPKMRRRASMLASVIDDIARAEGRHPSAVLADIVGPAVGSGIPSRGETAECGPGPGVPIYATDIERSKCMFRGRLALRAAEDRRESARQGERRALIDAADDESAREAQKESE